MKSRKLTLITPPPQSTYTITTAALKDLLASGQAHITGPRTATITGFNGPVEYTLHERHTDTLHFYIA